ncbi:MAG TPA: chromate resistance protein ChrB domain-containing protein [Ideonella sp.]|uniref:chromate resistance protein ChrB domain-containing protein n=1 Tax=Ideonella sp. TaxID=1929293 RepID=UPI002E304875|nr:chromate resistance protein ChrB domain-containing protein [Ideonella sp.]HEX5684539.1 chromate resistance protein ChrB domain-containing protein [Ideonella sp.]
MNDATSSWLLLVVSLPTQGATARMRIWRALKALGCAALRDGAYLLPAGADRHQALRELADDCVREGGTAWLMAVQPSADEEPAYLALFDRGGELAELRKTWKDANRGLVAMTPQELLRLQRRLQRDYDAVKATDYFPSDASTETEAAWTEFNRRIGALMSPDEPQDAPGELPRLDAAKYRGRTWATRRRLWVDRVASAWLIHRFIDPDARFKWLAKPADCPKSALGFDFDGATFTHVGDRVTFETLLASFGLDEDPALRRLGAMVHQLDVGGEPVPEAIGFEAVMAGARERLDDDDALLAEMGRVLDSLYAHFGRDASRAKT